MILRVKLVWGRLVRLLMGSQHAVHVGHAVAFPVPAALAWVEDTLCWYDRLP